MANFSIDPIRSLAQTYNEHAQRPPSLLQRLVTEKKNLALLVVADFAPLFDHLQTIQGSLDTRLGFVRETVNEAMRFKRRHLAGLLEEYLSKLQLEAKSSSFSKFKLHHNGAKIAQ